MKNILSVLCTILFLNVFANETTIKIYMDRIEINGNKFYSKDKTDIQKIKCALNGEKFVRRKLKNGSFSYIFVKSNLIIYSSNKNEDFYEMRFLFSKDKFNGNLYILDKLFNVKDEFCFTSDTIENRCIFPNKDEHRMAFFKSKDNGEIYRIDLRIHYAPWTLNLN